MRKISRPNVRGNGLRITTQTSWSACKYVEVDLTQRQLMQFFLGAGLSSSVGSIN